MAERRLTRTGAPRQGSLRRGSAWTPAWAATIALAVVGAAMGDDHVIGERRFSLPAGFVIELAAGPPLVERPITIDWDEQGRLYVAESSGSNDPVEKQLAERPHRILRLEDIDGDGQFDRRTIFADKMMFPEGTMWLDGSLYVSAPPQIWKLTDHDGDGVADERIVWFDGKTLTGCANDLHGPYLGPDGWIYWCKGAFAEQSYERPGRDPFKTRAAHIFRRRADGTGPVEPVMTGGMDNPVDVVFLRNGDRVFTSTFLVHPGGGERDGLIHALYGGVYGKRHDPIFDPVHKWTGPDVLPTLVHLGPAAPCGLTRYESDAFGAEYQDNLFACLFNMHKVTRHVLKQRGASYEATTEDFLTSPDIDFHPTDVLEDADGSLLVVDTGGWYKLCCPTSQLHKPDVPGAIYRIRKLDAPSVHDPRGRAVLADAASDNLIRLLGDPRPFVRRQATQRLARMGPDVALLSRAAADASPEACRNLIWATTQIERAEMREFVRQMLHSPDPSVRQCALHSISLWRDRDAAQEVEKLLLSGVDHDRRLAAEALGRLGQSTSVSALLKSAERDNDRALEHAITYALIEIADPNETAAGLNSASLNTVRAAMIALDQMGAPEHLDPRQIALWQSSGDDRLNRAAAWVIGRHAEWGGALAGYYREQWKAAAEGAADIDQLATQLGALATSPAIQALIADQLADASSSRAARLSLLRAMRSASLPELPALWIRELRGMLARDAENAELLDQAARLIQNRKVSESERDGLAAALTAAAMNDALADAVRLRLLTAVPAESAEIDDAAFAFLLQTLGHEEAGVRLAAVEACSHLKLTRAQYSRVAERLPSLGALELPRLLPAFERAGDEGVGFALVDALRKSHAAASLRAEQVEPILEKYPESVRARAAEWIDGLRPDAAEQRARLEELARNLPTGDARRGQGVFTGTKAACASCHAIGYLGGKLGPDLTRIGAIREERDLLEAIVFPSASFVRSYEPVAVATRDGRVLSGNILRETDREIWLALSADKEERIARDDVEEMRPSPVSIMPAGLDQQLTPQELADLVAFLRACR